MSTSTAAAPHRAILLVERELDGEPSMLTMRELETADAAYAGPVVTVTDAGSVARYRVVAAHFGDTTTFFPMLEQYEVWRLINLTEDTHPIHVHLDPFQIVGRRPLRFEVPDGAIADREITASIWLERDPDDTLDHAIDDNGACA